MLKLCVDVDGVLCDFVGGTAKLLGFDPARVTAWDYYPQVGTTEHAFWRAINEAGPDFWANLELYPWAVELWEECLALGETIMLTTPSQCPTSLAGKLRWMQLHFGSRFRQYLVGPRKEFCARPDTILIDDNDANCAAFEQHGGRAILFPRAWNANRHLLDPLAYTRDQLARLTDEIAVQA